MDNISFNRLNHLKELLFLDKVSWLNLLLNIMNKLGPMVNQLKPKFMELEVKLVWMDIGLTYKTGLHVLLPVEGVLKLFIEDVSPLNPVVKIVKEK